MSDHYRQQYRIPSARANWWDYRNEAAYFITICTAGKTHYFGTVRNRNMYLSKLGEIAKHEWLRTPMMRRDMHITLDEYIIMPNHFHAIIVIGENSFNSLLKQQQGDRRDAMPCVSRNERHNKRDAKHCVSTTFQSASAQNDEGGANRFGPQQKNLPSIIRGFKSSVTRRARQTQPDFAWQPRYYDHIIRDNNDWMRIREYIQNNPAQWGQTDDDDHNETPPRV
ncbi:hypothetical protein PbJCM13498_38900 [Prolixibacter bellariivorans]|uniref:Transposase IS200-like domain-containing protein n=1 Tax=Prolixibacter bellariivorans TaxID=314319 RepID=A0A5M4B5N0_9BACT|nr:transposase [Prolixibacter bellariivorans]GET35027.1 hypothetical protein PbJCM13498_38900 [Prolixibacter bellariivorans]